MKFRQKISEYVGQGHPDIIADRISNIIKSYATTSASETVVNRAGVYITGETVISDGDKRKAVKEIRNLINQLNDDYGNHSHVTIHTKFVKQDSMLAKRKKEQLSGDQEIVYFHKLDEKDVHYHLRDIDLMVGAITDTMDYKILVNMKNKTANLSISKSHKDFKRVQTLILEEIQKRFKIKIKNINQCIFSGGSIFNDTGVTGRKLLVEKEGTGYPHGGGAYYGKDETKAAVYGYDRLERSNHKDAVIVYYPGDKLTKPNYEGKI